jgi:FMN phosphatase YigB (HAD superfamily)
MSKPDPGIYALACERLRVEPAQMVFLDDSGPCVEGARRAGIHAVLYQDNSQAVSDIENLLCATLPRLDAWRETLVTGQAEQGSPPGSELV